jgi:hypothetical protein
MEGTRPTGVVVERPAGDLEGSRRARSPGAPRGIRRRTSRGRAPSSLRPLSFASPSAPRPGRLLHALPWSARPGPSHRRPRRPRPPQGHQPRRVGPGRLPQPRPAPPPLRDPSPRVQARRATPHGQGHPATSPAARPRAHSQDPQDPPVPPYPERPPPHGRPLRRSGRNPQAAHRNGCLNLRAMRRLSDVVEQWSVVEGVRL